MQAPRTVQGHHFWGIATGAGAPAGLEEVVTVPAVGGQPRLMSHQPVWPHARRESSGVSFLQSSGVSQGIPPALLEATGHALETGQLDLDSAALSAALGLGQDNVLAHLQRTAQEIGSGGQPEISSILAASIGVPPVDLPLLRKQ